MDTVYQFSDSYDHPFVQENIKRIKHYTPEFKYQHFNTSEAERYIRSIYDMKMLKVFQSINPKYGACRADLFRYLLMYKEGGVYLDIKSGFFYPFNLSNVKSYCLTYWQEKYNSAYVNNKYGEFQQFYIVCYKQHPFLKAVLENVINNILNYNYTISYESKKAEIHSITGPIVYSNTILEHPKFNNKFYPYCTSESLGIRYNTLHRNYRKIIYSDRGATYYSEIDEPLILK